MADQVEDEVVTMMCLTTKRTFEVTNPTVVVLNNGRYAYKEVCPWTGKNEKVLTAFKFCGVKAYERYLARQEEVAEITDSLEEEDVA